MKAAIYIRVSTEEQAKEGYSIEAQKRKLTDFCHTQEWEIFDYYVDDGYSAKNLDRPALQRMIADLKEKKFDVVLVYKLDRLVRSMINLQELLQLFEKHDIKFHSFHEKFETHTAAGRLFLNIVGSMAEFERLQIAERVKVGMEQRHLKGERNGAVAPYGYDLVDGELVVNPEEAVIVRRIFDMYRTKGTRAIAQILNMEGVPRRDGSRWSAFTVSYILENPVYIGKLRWNYRRSNGKRTFQEIIVDGEHEPIISEELFVLVQKLKTQRTILGPRSTSVYVFTGILRCGRCGKPMNGGGKDRKNGRYHFYKCSGRFQQGICDMPIIAEDSIEDIILNHVETFIDDEVISQIAVTQEEPQNDLRKELEEELKRIQNRKKKWQLAFAEDVITIEELRARTLEDRQREENIKRELARLNQASSNFVDIHEIKSHLLELKEVWHDLDPVLRKQFLHEIFEHITIDTPVKRGKGAPGRHSPVVIVDFAFRS